MAMALTLPERKTLTLEAARVALEGAEAEARRNELARRDRRRGRRRPHRRSSRGWTAPSGRASRPPSSKARAAVAWKRPSRLLEESVNNGRTAFLSIAQGMAILQGGVPIEVDGTIVGAVGVSGVKASDDEVIALAGVTR